MDAEQQRLACLSVEDEFPEADAAVVAEVVRSSASIQAARQSLELLRAHDSTENAYSSSAPASASSSFLFPLQADASVASEQCSTSCRHRNWWPTASTVISNVSAMRCQASKAVPSHAQAGNTLSCGPASTNSASTAHSSTFGHTNQPCGSVADANAATDSSTWMAVALHLAASKKHPAVVQDGYKPQMGAAQQPASNTLPPADIQPAAAAAAAAASASHPASQQPQPTHLGYAPPMAAAVPMPHHLSLVWSGPHLMADIPSAGLPPAMRSSSMMAHVPPTLPSSIQAIHHATLSLPCPMPSNVAAPLRDQSVALDMGKTAAEEQLQAPLSMQDMHTALLSPQQQQQQQQRRQEQQQQQQQVQEQQHANALPPAQSSIHEAPKHSYISPSPEGSALSPQALGSNLKPSADNSATIHNNSTSSLQSTTPAGGAAANPPNGAPAVSVDISMKVFSQATVSVTMTGQGQDSEGSAPVDGTQVVQQVATAAVASSVLSVEHGTARLPASSNDIAYAGVFLTEASREVLLSLVPPLYREVRADHMTLMYRPSASDVLGLPLGLSVTLEVQGMAANHRCQAVHVLAEPWLPPTRSASPHVTISVADGVPAKESGALIAQALESNDPSYQQFPDRFALVGQVGVRMADGTIKFSAHEFRECMGMLPGMLAQLEVMQPLILSSSDQPSVTAAATAVAQAAAPARALQAVNKASSGVLNQPFFQQQQQQQQQEGLAEKSPPKRCSIHADSCTMTSITTSALLPAINPPALREGSPDALSSARITHNRCSPSLSPSSLNTSPTGKLAACAASTMSPRKSFWASGSPLPRLSAAYSNGNGPIFKSPPARSNARSSDGRLTSSSFRSGAVINASGRTAFSETRQYRSAHRHSIAGATSPRDGSGSQGQARGSPSRSQNGAMGLYNEQPAGTGYADPLLASSAATATDGLLQGAGSSAAPPGTSAIASAVGGGNDHNDKNGYLNNTAFDMWMADGGADSAFPSLADTSDSSPRRVRQLNAVAVGDVVSVCPLTVDAADDSFVTGTTEEIMLDDDYQPMGVLVRLSDNTMGYVVKVILKQSPTPRTGAAAVAAVAKGVATATTPRGQWGAMRDKQAPSGPWPLLAAAGAAGSALCGAGAARKGAAGQAAAGTIEEWERLRKQYGEAITAAILEDCCYNVEAAVATLKAQSLPNALSSIVSKVVSKVQQEADLGGGGLGSNLDSTAGGVRHGRASRPQLQQRPNQSGNSYAPRHALNYGPNSSSGKVTLTQAYASEAVTLNVGAELARQLIGDVTVDAWSNGPPPLAGTSTTPANSTETATSKSPHVHIPRQDADGGAGWGGRNFTPQDGTSTRPGLGFKAFQPTQWVASNPSNHPLKLLQKQDSLSAASVAAAVSIKSAEALKAMLPGYSHQQLVSALAAAAGDVNSAAEALLLSSPPVPSATAAAASPAVASAAAAEKFVANSIAQSEDLAVLNALPFEERVAHILNAFQGLDHNLADYILRLCHGDVHHAFEYLTDSIQVHTSKKPASDASMQKPRFSSWSAGDSVMVKAETIDKNSSGDGTEWQVVQAAARRSSPLRPADADGPVFMQNSNPEAMAAKQVAMLEANKARHVAQVYYDARNIFFQQAAMAYAAGNGKMAAEYSRRGREHGELAKTYRRAANEAAFRGCNSAIRNEYTMDLHHMHVDEALAMLRRHLSLLAALDAPEGVLLKVITGVGRHSINGVPLIKNNVLAYLKEQGYRHQVDPSNEGMIHVQVGGR